MEDSLSYCFLFQPVLHSWINKSCGMYYPESGMVHIKEPLLLTSIFLSRTGEPANVSTCARDRRVLLQQLALT